MKNRILFYVFSAALLLSFSACGDDSSSVDSRPSDNPELLEENFDSLDELPICGAENRGALAKVKETRYTCFTNAWVPVKEFVAGVCNIRACDDDVAGKFYYVESDKEAYQCVAGTWKKSSGATFSDSEFVDCYVSAIVTANVESKDSLEACSSKREGDLADVAGKLYVCMSKKWQKQTDAVISESDLGKCTKDGVYKYVLSKSASYSCKDGSWLKDGKAVSVASSSSSSKNLSSSSKKHSSSSSAEEKKSSAKESSSSKTPDIELPVDDGTKVRGVCIVSEKSAVRDSSVTYSFYNMGGTPVTFSWDFGDKASPTTSQEISPTVTYKRGGAYHARLIINEGKESESDTIICSKVKVSGIPVTDCLCETQTDTLQVSIDYPDSATWKISGCKGGQEFTYEWEGPANYTWNPSADSSSIVGVTTRAGLFSPNIEIVNDESESLFISCPAVYVKGIVSASCYMDLRYDEDGNDDGYTFTVSNFKNVGELPSLSMTLSGDDGYSENVDITARNPNYWGWERASYVIPKSAVPDLHTYTLTYGKYDVCSVTPVNCGASEKSVFRNDTSHWGLIGVGDYTATSYSWIFVDKMKGKVATSTDAKPKMSFKDTGSVYATVVLDEGLESEMTISCPTINVENRSISNCSCELNLVSESDSITESNEVVFEWNVTGCESEGAEPFTYTWSVGYDATDASVTRTFTNRGKYTPNVTVENQDGSTATPQCPTATVKGVLENEGTMTDARDGKVYRTVKIGEQTWMAENLNYDTTGAVCFENSPDNCEKFGRLYSASLAQVVCPEGWHLPTNLEFETLLDSAGGFDNLKSSEWNGGNNPYGFSALPAGKYDYVSGKKFTTDQFITGWWLYTETIDYLAPLYGVYVDYGPRFTDDDNENGFSVRCLED
jgi:PKD domain./Fibrobacter succinogenes major domain (Fib_succ_major).